jgi:hypothetical protein
MPTAVTQMKTISSKISEILFGLLQGKSPGCSWIFPQTMSILTVIQTFPL